MCAAETLDTNFRVVWTHPASCVKTQSSVGVLFFPPLGVGKMQLSSVKITQHKNVVSHNNWFTLKTKKVFFFL